MNKKILSLAVLGILASAFSPLWAENERDKNKVFLQILEQNRQQPLSDLDTSISLEVNGSSIDGAIIHTDANGMADITDFILKNTVKLEEYQGRTQFMLWMNDRKIPLPENFLSAEQPVKVFLNLGSLLIKAHFVDEKGKKITSPLDFYPVEIRPYLEPKLNQWRSFQIRLNEKGEDGQEKTFINEVQRQMDQEGNVQMPVNKNKTYRLEFIGLPEVTVLNPQFTTGDQDTDLPLITHTDPFCVYGLITDSVTSKPPESVNLNITGPSYLTRWAFSQNAHYAFCLPESGTMRINVNDFAQQYPAQLTFDLTQNLQRQDLVIRPLTADPQAVRLRFKIEGVDLKNFHDVGISLFGDQKHFSSSFQDFVEKNTYELVVTPGQYTMQVDSRYFYFPEVPSTLDVSQDDTMTLKGFKKDTQLIVRIIDAQGRPFKFPPDFSKHTPRENCVILENDPPPSKTQAARFLDYETADVGGALRPDENGEVKFTLATGGNYLIRARFNQYEEGVVPLKIKTHKSQTVEVQLKAFNGNP